MDCPGLPAVGQTPSKGMFHFCSAASPTRWIPRVRTCSERRFHLWGQSSPCVCRTAVIICLVKSLTEELEAKLKLNSPTENKQSICIWQPFSWFWQNSTFVPSIIVIATHFWMLWLSFFGSAAERNWNTVTVTGERSSCLGLRAADSSIQPDRLDRPREEESQNKIPADPARFKAASS